MPMKNGTIYGEYSALLYRVWKRNSATGDDLLYMGGNSEWDSQGYVSAREGVGIERMREYCEITTREFAGELHAPYGGVHEEDQT